MKASSQPLPRHPRAALTRYRRFRHATIYLLVAGALPQLAQAARVDYELGISVLHSDNIGLSEFDEVSDTVVSPILRFNAEANGTVFQLSADGDIQYPYYVDDTFDNQVQGNLYGRANWVIVPQSIEFEVTDNLSRQAINVLNAFVPSNQQQVNVFTAGPNFTFRLGDAADLAIDLKYANTYAEETSQFQGDRYNATVAIERRLNPTDQVSFNLQALQTAYDDIGALYDYRRYDAYVSYISTLSAIDLKIDAGYSRITPENYGSESSSPLLRSTFTWNMTPSSSLAANIDYQFSDAAQNLIWRDDQVPGPITNPTDPLDPTLPIGAQSFKHRRFGLVYGYTSPRFNLQVNPYFEKIRYIGASTEDQDVTSFNARAEYRLTPTTRMSLAGIRQKREYADVIRNDTTSVINLSLIHEVSRHWYGQVSYQYSNRDSSSFTQSYVENSIMFMVAYRR